MTQLNLLTVLKRTEDFLRRNAIASPRLEAEMMLANVLKTERLQLYLDFDKPLLESELAPLRPMLKRRIQREPLPWILGEWGFYNEEFIVLPDVLCPRSDTEALINIVLEHIPKEGDFFVADIGCGSGCIGLTLALERPNIKLFAVDIASAALECTKRNVAKFDLQDRVAVLKGPFLNPIPANRPIDIIVSNPPYIPSADIEDLEPEVSEYEPRIALDGGADGLDVYNVLIPKAAQRARVAVAVEVGIHQALKVSAIMQDSGLCNIQVVNDLGGVPRVVMGFK